MCELAVKNKLSRTWTSTGQFELLVWASLSVPTGRGKSLCYAIPSYFQTNRDLKDCFVHLRFESNSAIEQDEASIVHRARRNALSWDSFIASRAGETNLYQTLHVHVHWTWQHKISIPFTWRKIIPNSANQNGIGRFPDFSSPLKSLACETSSAVVGLGYLWWVVDICGKSSN